MKRYKYCANFSFGIGRNAAQFCKNLAELPSRFCAECQAAPERFSPIVDAPPRPLITTESITDQLCAEFRARADHGLKKYGVTLDRDDLTEAQWDQHLLEELMDACGYLKARMASRVRLLDELKEIVRLEGSNRLYALIKTLESK